MSNPSKGARLWLRPASKTRKATWIIRDGEKQCGTGCGAGEREEAEKALASYLAAKHRPTRQRSLALDDIPIADVIHIYAAEKGASVARPSALASRLGFLLRFFGKYTLADISFETCAAYARVRGYLPAARRELEDLRAAVRYHWKSGHCDRETRVTLPDKSPPRERWLTRDEAAKLLWTAWRRPQRHHVVRFMLVGLYTGTRASAICTASLQPEEGRGLVDVDRGVFYRLAQGAKQTNKRQPTIRIPTRLLTHIRRWRDLGISNRAVVEYEGRPVASVKKAFARTVREAGLEGVTQHTLRHTAITWAMQNSADIYEAAGFFGVSPRLIEQVYGHHHPDHQTSVGAAVTARPSQVGHRLARTKSVKTPQTAVIAP